MNLDRINDTILLLQQANDRVKERRYSDARRILQEIITGHADKTAAYTMLIKIERDLNNVHDAISLAEEASKKLPGNDEILLNLGWLYFTAGADTRAALCAATLVDRPVLSVSLAGRRLLIFIRARRKEWSDAGEHFNKIQEQDSIFCGIVAKESAPTFQGVLVKTLADGDIPAAYKLLEVLPQQVAPELARIIEHLALQPSKFPEHSALFNRNRLVRAFHKFTRNALSMVSLNSSLQANELRDTNPRLKISVITPVLNGENTIRFTIESVLQQDKVDLEYIIVDGGSTDKTLSIIEEYSDRIHLVLSEKDKGLYDAVGKGFDLATGDIFCYLNASDTFENSSLSRVVAAFSANPGYEIIYFDETLNYGIWKTQNKRQPEVGFLKLWRGHILFQASVFFTKRAYLAVGGINRSLKLAGDSDLWLRLSFRFEFKYCRGYTSTSSVHKGQLSEDMVKYYGEFIRMRQSFSEVISSTEWLYAILYDAFLVLRKHFSILSVDERRYRRLLFPLMPLNVASPSVRDTCLDYDICPFSKTPSSMFVASILCADQGALRVNRVVFNENSSLLSVYPKFLLDPPGNGCSEWISDDSQLCCASSENVYQHACRLMQPKRLSIFVISSLMLRALNGRAKIRSRTKQSNVCSSRIASKYSPLPSSCKTFIRGKILISGDLTDGLFDEAIAKIRADEKFQINSNRSIQTLQSFGDATVGASPGECIGAAAATCAFETIIVQDSQVLVHNPGAYLRDISEFLAPDGRMIVVLPNMNSFLFDLFGINWRHLRTSVPSLIFSRTSIDLLADKAGMRVESIYTFTSERTIAHHLCVKDRDSVWHDSLVRRICMMARYMFNWRLLGDEFVVVMSKQ